MTGLKGIVMHWTAGGAKASALDKQHYHYLVQQDGQIIPGACKPEDNISTSDGKYAAHTMNANTGRIGVSLCGMMGAVERPFQPGSAPITWLQIEVFCGLVADLCVRYSIPVTRLSVLSHAEVQPSLLIKQRGKWDIAWLPGMVSVGNPVDVGDRLRRMILDHMKGGT